ncbi:MAG: hypothetical protein CMJ05_08530 [Pelagibacterales bacterium]|nr:hypothetical protein [Pelagibacterales bacterium]|tara:strand:- start:16178 stop:16798 length:621 start_codon:yes stop_codon:yes gene_type:complete
MDDFLFKEDFLVELNYVRFFVGLVITLVLVFFIKNNYLASTFSNDNKINFSRILIPFSLSMLLIVSVIKTSLALSLGLVGALSIIRFRTAIKESEQIITLLIVLAISIAVAAEKEILAVIVSFVYIILNRKKAESLNINNRLIIISFKSAKDIKIKDLEIMNIHRLYKTIDGLYTVEYFLDSNNNIDAFISNLKEKLKVDIDYEIN